jgi:hypothetical protein
MPHTPPPNLEGLVRLSRREGVDIRPALLRVLTDLYVQETNHTREEEQQYVELALRLLPVVDVPTRQAVASKLGSYSCAPTPIIEYLAGDVPQVAKSILRHPELEPNPSRTDLAGIDGSPVSTETTQRIVAPASDDQNVGPVGAAAANAGTAALGETFLQARPAERLRLLAEFDATPPTAPGTSIPSHNAELVRRLELAALQRNEREFARELQYALRLPHETTLRIARDPSGEPLVVVALALAMPGAVLQRILLFLNPAIGESVERVFALSRLYDELSHRAATPIITSWQDEAARRAAVRYVGVHADEPGTGGTALMDNARRSVTGRTGEAARRTEAARPRGWTQRTT